MTHDPREDALAKAIFRAGFHPDEDEKTVTAKWHEWDSDRKMSFDRARAALAALTPSPTPYVRPAAEIQAEIERQTNSYGAGTFGGSYPYFQGYVAGLTFALTPPTQEPR